MKIITTFIIFIFMITASYANENNRKKQTTMHSADTNPKKHYLKKIESTQNLIAKKILKITDKSMEIQPKSQQIVNLKKYRDKQIDKFKKNGGDKQDIEPVINTIRKIQSTDTLF